MARRKGSTPRVAGSSLYPGAAPVVLSLGSPSAAPVVLSLGSPSAAPATPRGLLPLPPFPFCLVPSSFPISRCLDAPEAPHPSPPALLPSPFSCLGLPSPLLLQPQCAPLECASCPLPCSLRPVNVACPSALCLWGGAGGRGGGGGMGKGGQRPGGGRGASPGGLHSRYCSVAACLPSANGPRDCRAGLRAEAGIHWEGRQTLSTTAGEEAVLLPEGPEGGRGVAAEGGAHSAVLRLGARCLTRRVPKCLDSPLPRRRLSRLRRAGLGVWHLFGYLPQGEEQGQENEGVGQGKGEGGGLGCPGRVPLQLGAHGQRGGGWIVRALLPLLYAGHQWDSYPHPWRRVSPDPAPAPPWPSCSPPAPAPLCLPADPGPCPAPCVCQALSARCPCPCAPACCPCPCRPLPLPLPPLGRAPPVMGNPFLCPSPSPPLCAPLPLCPSSLPPRAPVPLAAKPRCCQSLTPRPWGPKIHPSPPLGGAAAGVQQKDRRCARGAAEGVSRVGPRPFDGARVRCGMDERRPNCVLLSSIQRECSPQHWPVATSHDGPAPRRPATPHSPLLRLPVPHSSPFPHLSLPPVAPSAPSPFRSLSSTDPSLFFLPPPPRTEASGAPLRTPTAFCLRPPHTNSRVELLRHRGTLLHLPNPARDHTDGQPKHWPACHGLRLAPSAQARLLLWRQGCGSQRPKGMSHPHSWPPAAC